MPELPNLSLSEAVSRVVSDLADLMQKEMRLAKAEIANKLSIGFRAGVWMSAAAVFSLSAATGLALHWSSLIVAAALAAIAAASFAKGKADAPALAPDRAIHQVKRDIAVAKEQFS
jgi:hypothetical protein